MNDDLLRYRELFPILERTVYLNSNSLGPMRRTVRDQLGRYMDQWDQRGVRAWLCVACVSVEMEFGSW